MATARRSGTRFKHTNRIPLRNGFLRGCDACCVIGGDGTLLGVAGEAARTQVPIIGVNRGSLGFLTTFSPDEARAHFSELLRGHFVIDHRSMLAGAIGSAPADLVLNDVLIKAEANSSLARLGVFADGELVTDYVCDGLILSTTTGSTAYNLSAGGPIIHPSARVIAMTPICPHTLTNRTVIFPDTVKLEVFNRVEDTRLLVAMDGQRNLGVCTNAPVRISLAKLTLPLAQHPNYRYFSVLRTKLDWSGGLTSQKP
jgi:NAD+ kinase